MRLQRAGAVVLRQVYLLRGSPARVVPLFAWVAIDIVLWGFITRYLSAISAPGFHVVPALLGAVLLWDFLTRVMQGVTMAFFEDVWSPDDKSPHLVLAKRSSSNSASTSPMRALRSSTP